MRCRLGVVALLGLLTIGVAVAEAQPGSGRGGGRGRGGRFGGGPRGGDLTQLVMIEEVQAELEIVPDQRDAITQMAEELRARRREQFAGFRDLSEDERRERFEQMQEQARADAAKTKAKLGEVLLPHQMDRLQQLQWQRMGTRVLGDEAFVEAIGLSDEQKQQLATLAEENQTKMREMFQQARESGGDPGSFREQFEKARTEAEQQAMAVLTSDQQGKYTELLGEKFEFPEGRGFGRGPGGGRGEGRGPGRGEGRGDGQGRRGGRGGEAE